MRAGALGARTFIGACGRAFLLLEREKRRGVRELLRSLSTVPVVRPRVMGSGWAKVIVGLRECEMNRGGARKVE
jgi:hypothetical protein